MIKKPQEKMPHKLPSDLKMALVGNRGAMATWDDITPLAQNEWICWVISPKLAETREKRVKRASDDLAKGKRRPCCWPGCPHRKK